MWPFSGVHWDFCLWEAALPLPNVFPAGEPPLPMWLEDLSDLTLCFQGFVLPTRALPGIELWSSRFCTSPVYRVFVEFKPSPFSSFLLLSPFFVQPLPCGCFHSYFFSLAGFGGRCCFSCTFPHLPPLSASKIHSLHSVASLSPSSWCCVPAEFCGSGCADCCVNPQISFLGVQGGFVLIWLHFRGKRRKKTSMLFCHLGSPAFTTFQPAFMAPVSPH